MPKSESRWITALVCILLAVPFFGCSAGKEERISASSSVPVQPSPAVETIRLDPEEAAQYARSIQESVSVRPAEGLELQLWATEQLIDDPIAIDVEADGRVLITGSSRSGGLLDIRGHPTWTTEALAMKTVEEHRDFLRRELAPERSEENEWLPDLNQDGSRDWRDLTVQKERIYRLEDRSGDGVADVADILVEGFNTEISDVAGALMARGRDIYVASAPEVWRLQDLSGDGIPDSQEPISYGYGVHPGFFGHGISGLRMGPDGRVYWSVGDMGFNVTDGEGRQWIYPNQGGIFRANPDGSELEVFAVGLRNTHEFVFDEYGNIISVDNDGDHPGEKERIVYIVEGSDAGWRTNWQFGKYTDSKNNEYKVWMDEDLFKPRFEGQAAYITPPVANYHSGPAGMAYNPGTALSEDWGGYFFMAEYVGSPARSNIHAFRLKESGAGFELADDKPALNGILPVGITFGPDGALYVADWIEGWDSKGTGRIWKLDATDPAADELKAEVSRLLAESFDRTADDVLVRLLGHADMRVRTKAQFELVDRGREEVLARTATLRGDRLRRIHAIWGLGQLARADDRNARHFIELLRDEDPEIRSQAAKTVGDLRYAQAAEALLPLLGDTAARVRFFAAEALGRIAYRPSVDSIVDMLARNDDEDVFLRHAGALALARIGEADAVMELAAHSSPGVRLAAVVALRRMKHSGVGQFVLDEDEHVVTEAARAINDDGGIEGALPNLAGILGRTPFTGEPLLRRAINANLRLGTAEAARRVAEFASRVDAPPAMRAEAIDVLGVWSQPSALDRVDGIYHGPAERDPAIAQRVVASLVDPLLADTSMRVRAALAKTAGRMRLREADSALLKALQQDDSPSVRVAALEALHELDSRHLDEAVRLGIEDLDAPVRLAAVDLVSRLELSEATTAELLETILEAGGIEEQQRALDVLGTIQGLEAQRVLSAHFDRLADGELPPEVHLDLIEAAERSGNEELRSRVEKHLANRTGPVEEYRETLYGGDVSRGRRVFFSHPAAQCSRCHSFNPGGTEVGPNLTDVAQRLNREELLEALVDPSARIAPGFGTAPSAMPPMAYILTRREIRDVVAFLATLE